MSGLLEMPSVPPEKTLAHESSGFTFIAQLVTLVAIVLPAIGFISRYLALAFIPRARIPGIASIASGESVATLAAIGAQWSALPAVVGLFCVWIGYRSGHKFRRAASCRTRSQLIGTLAVVALIFVVMLIFAVLYEPAAVIMAFTGESVVGVEVGSFAEIDKFSVKHLSIVIATLSIFATLSGGLFQTQLPTGKVSFSSSVAMSSGFYVILGSNSSQTFLLPCNSIKSLLSVNSQQIVRITYVVPKRTKASIGLLTLLHSNGLSPLGAGNACPRIQG
jgi:hypothetical protein